LARQTRQLLDDAELRRLMGEAGRQRVHALFSATLLIERFARVYGELLSL
jgi:hypothetical protein